MKYKNKNKNYYWVKGPCHEKIMNILGENKLSTLCMKKMIKKIIGSKAPAMRK
jgi:hypothetical protein